MTDRARRHKLIIDCWDWNGPEGREYRVTVSIDEAHLSDLVGRAMNRHDHRTELGNGAFVVEVEPVSASGSGAPLFTEPTP